MKYFERRDTEGISPRLLPLFAAFGLVAPMALAGSQPLVNSIIEEASEDGAEAEEEADVWTAIMGGDIVTGTGEMLRGATLLSKNGKIEAIGYDLYIPEEAEIHNVTGLRLYPGMVALSASSRITQGTLAPENPDRFVDLTSTDGEDWDAEDWDNEDWNEDWAADDTAAVASSEKGILDDYDPFSPFMTLALGAGITTVEQSGNAVKLRTDSIEDVLIAEGNLSSFSFSSGDARRRAREDFAGAADYLRAFRAWEDKGDKDAEEPDKKGVNSGALKVLRGETRAKFNASSREELLGIARLAQTYGFRPIIEGAREGWTVADELGRAGATIMLVPRERRGKESALLNAEGGSSIENAAKLYSAGCQIAVQPLSGAIDLGGIAGRDLLHLMIEAGFAVRGGLSETAALQAVTIIPARVLGCDHRVGTLEVGKDADVIVTDGDLLHYETFVQKAFVGGQLSYDKANELFYAHIRPLPEVEAAAEESDEDSKAGDGDEEPEGEDQEAGDGDDE